MEQKLKTCFGECNCDKQLPPHGYIYFIFWEDGVPLQGVAGQIFSKESGYLCLSALVESNDVSAQTAVVIVRQIEVSALPEKLTDTDRYIMAERKRQRADMIREALKRGVALVVRTPGLTVFSIIKAGGVEDEEDGA